MKPNEASPLAIEHRDGVLSLTLNRPTSANALSPSLVEALIKELVDLNKIRLISLRGEGKHFCAGLDLADIDDLSDGDLLWRILRIEKLLQLVHHAPVPVAAFAQGQVVGAGADLFAACWRRVAASNANFRFPGWNFDLALGTRRLARLVGSEAASDLLIDTKILSAEQACQVGLASQLAEPEEWPSLIECLRHRASALSPIALRDMLALTRTDSRSEDLAEIVTTAGQPGLKARIVGYRDRVKLERRRS